MNKKIVIIFIFIILLCGCNKKEEKEIISNSNIKNSNVESKKNNKKENKKEEKKEDIYKINFDEDNRVISKSLTMKIIRANVSNPAREENAKKINKYLDKVVDDASVNFEEYLNEKDNYDTGYTFEYEYSLLEENDKYLIFKLDYKWQAGGPYPTYSEEYYMFDKENGNIVEFDDLFKKNIKKDVKNNIAEKINKIYEKQGDEYTDELSDDVYIIGFYVLTKGKLKFTLPRGYFTSSAYGSLNIDIDEDIYKEYIK